MTVKKEMEITLDHQKEFKKLIIKLSGSFEYKAHSAFQAAYTDSMPNEVQMWPVSRPPCSPSKRAPWAGFLRWT